MIQQVTHRVCVETGIVACNLGLVDTGDGLVLVDTPMGPADAVNWRGEVERRGDMRYLINTEAHPDHWYGDYFFPGLLISHVNTREKLAKSSAAEVREDVRKTDPASLPLVEDYQIRLPDITFNGSMDIHLGDLTLSLFELPGHVPGGIGVHIPEERVVFTGDIVFHKWKSWLHESDPDKWLNSLKKIESLDVDFIVPGHGELCGKEYLSEQADIVRKWTEVVRSAVERGLSEKEAQVRIACPDPYPIQPGVPLSATEVNRRSIAHLYALEIGKSSKRTA